MNSWNAAAALAAACLLATTAHAEVIELADGGFVTRDAAAVGADPQAVWLTLISPGDWWADSHSWSGDSANMTITPQGGGCFCERIPAKDEPGAFGLDGSVQHMVVLQANPRKVLRMRGSLGPLQSEPVSGVLTITLKPIERGTRIVFEYVVGGFMRYEPEVIAKAVDGVMSQQLAGLADRLGRIEDPEAKPAPPPAAKPDPAKEPTSTPAETATSATTVKPAARPAVPASAAPAKPAETPKPKSESAIGEDFLDDSDEPAPKPAPKPTPKPADGPEAA
jgi:cell pole-organizing protein PopZ